MDIKRKRTRKTGTLKVPNYSGLLYKLAGYKMLDADHARLQFYTDYVTPEKVITQQCTDELLEGYPVYDPMGTDRWPKFGPLRRTAIWPRAITATSKDSGITRWDIPVLKIRLAGRARERELFYRFGFAESTQFGSYSLRVRSLGRSRAETLAEAHAIASSVDAAISRELRPTYEIGHRVLYTAWTDPGYSIPTPYAVARPGPLPSGFMDNSNEMKEARFRAWESLQAGGTTISGLNRLQAVLECKDVPGTFSAIFDFAKFLTSATRRKKVVLMGMSMVQLAQSYLWWKFGVKPTYTDATKWLDENIKGKVVATVESAENSLHVGDTIRCAYSVNNTVKRPELPPVRRWENDISSGSSSYISGVQEADSIAEHDTFGYIMLPSAVYPTVSLLKDSPWSHDGVMFSRALTPGQEMMPDWYWDLYTQPDKGLTIAPLSAAKRGFVINPPGRTAWALIGYSFIADWVANFGETLSRLERAFTRTMIRVGFKSLWACDNWSAKPHWLSPQLITQVRDVSFAPFGDIWQFRERYFFPPPADAADDILVIAIPKVFAHRGYLKWKVQGKVASTLSSKAIHPFGGAEQLIVKREEIPKPQIPAVSLRATLGAPRVLLLGALSIQRISKVSTLLNLMRKLTK